MKLLQSLRKINTGLAVGILFGIPSLAYTLYFAHFEDKNPNLLFQIESYTEVFDLKEDISKLKIFYLNEDIKENNKTLSVFKIKILNNSNIPITTTLYDPNVPLGFSVENGELIERPEIIEASNDYLIENLKFSIDSTGKILIPPLIIDGDQYFIFDILTIHDKNTAPEIKPLGKIAGVNEIRVIDTFSNRDKNSFWKDLIYGGFLIHITRFSGYILLGLISVVIAVIAIEVIDSSIGKFFRNFQYGKRDKICVDFRDKHDITISKPSGLIFIDYKFKGKRYLKKILKCIESPEKMKILRLFDVKNNSLEDIENFYKEVKKNNTIDSFPDCYDIIIDLYKVEMITIDENKNAIINKDYENILNLLISYLNKT